jgi:hypothetical protein
VFDILVLAKLHGACLLKSRAIVFLKANITEVVKTEGWRELHQNDPDLMDEVFAAIGTM